MVIVTEDRQARRNEEDILKPCKGRKQSEGKTMMDHKERETECIREREPGREKEDRKGH